MPICLFYIFQFDLILYLFLSTSLNAAVIRQASYGTMKIGFYDKLKKMTNPTSCRGYCHEYLFCLIARKIFECKSVGKMFHSPGFVEILIKSFVPGVYK